MKVKMLKLAAGPFGTHRPGDVLEVTEHEGRMLIADRAAICIDAEPVHKLREAAAFAAAPETAAAVPAARKRRTWAAKGGSNGD